MRASVLAAVVSAVLFAPGCGGGDEDATKPASPASAATSVPSPNAGAGRITRPAACSLVSQEEMSRILGGALAAPQGENGVATTSCTYSPAAEDAITPYAEVKIDWDAGEEAMMGTRIAEKLMQRDAGFSVSEKIDGVGDEASMMIGNVMNVRKGRTFISITLAMQSEPKEKGTAIAKTILARLDDGTVVR